MKMPTLLKPLAPGYRLAQQKREFEKYLRAQGWTRQEAKQAVALKYKEAGGPA